MKYKIRAFLYFEDFWISDINDTVSSANTDYPDLHSAIEAFCEYVVNGYTIDSSNLDEWLQTDYLDDLNDALGDVCCYGGIVLLPEGAELGEHLFRHSIEYNFVSRKFAFTNEVNINTEYSNACDELEKEADFYEILNPVIERRPNASFSVEYDRDDGFVFEVWQEGFIYEGYELGFYQ